MNSFSRTQFLLGSDAMETVVLQQDGFAVMNDAEACGRVPVDAEVHIVKRTSVDHVYLAHASFFCRTGEVFDRAFNVMFFKVFLENVSTFHTAASEQIMAAPVSGSAVLQRGRTVNVCLLTQVRQGIQLSEDADHR